MAGTSRNGTALSTVLATNRTKSVCSGWPQSASCMDCILVGTTYKNNAGNPMLGAIQDDMKILHPSAA